MAEIMTNGPVEADYQVFSDFPQYKRGVYQRHSNENLGGHQVQIIGWGVEEKVVLANSWNKYCRDEGFFKIKRGVNECGIEGDINAGIPDLDSLWSNQEQSKLNLLG
jgi:cathepsin B